MLPKRNFYNFLIFIVTISYLAFAFLPILALAQDRTPPPITPKANISTACELLKLISDLVKWLLVVGLIIGVIVIIWGGITFVTAGGSTEKAGTAGKIIAFAAVGIVFIALAYAIVRVIGNLLGIDFTASCGEVNLLE